MNQLNNTIIEGNLISWKLEENTLMFKIANNRFYKDKIGNKQTEISYFDIESIDNLLESQFSKELKIRVVGRLKQKRWVDNCGKEQSRIVIIAEHVEIC